MTRRRKNIVGWLVWIIPVAILFAIGVTYFQNFQLKYIPKYIPAVIIASLFAFAVTHVQAHRVGWLVWIILAAFLFTIGVTDFQFRHINYFVVIIILLSSALVIVFASLYGRKQDDGGPSS